MEKVICPICEKDDQIQKVTSIVTGGVSTTSYQTYGGDRTAVSVTNLASRLRPPRILTEGASIGRWFFYWIVFAAIFGFLLSWLINASTVVAAAIGGIASGAIMGYAYRKEVAMLNYNKTVLHKLMKNYAELYYCHRDDRVFNPTTGANASPEDIQRLLL